MRTLTLLSTFVLPALALAATRDDAPATMKAIRMHEYGGPSVLKLEDVPVPAPNPGEVLVRVQAAGVNPVDWKVRQGALAKRGATLPMTPGYDLAGVVEKLGEGVTTLKVGDAVYGFEPLATGGAYAQYATIAASRVTRAPESIGPVLAAAMPVAALTAWQALVDTAHLDKGQTVLVHGGAGGVGHFAVQIAKLRGAHVVATASKRNLEFLRELGVDQVVDYQATKFEETVRDVDVVLDTVGGDTLARSYDVVKKGGWIVSIVEAPKPAELEKRGIQGQAILVDSKSDELATLAKLVDEKKITPSVSATIPLADAGRAQELSETGHTRGKIVLKVD